MFLQNLRVPACIVSNIDTHDLRSAIASAGWSFERIVTSEACRAYKPRKEVFLAALAIAGCCPEEVLHVGDSLRSDVRGAQLLGIDAAWVNRKERGRPAGVTEPKFVVSDLRQLNTLLNGAT